MTKNQPHLSLHEKLGNQNFIVGVKIEHEIRKRRRQQMRWLIVSLAILGISASLNSQPGQTLEALKPYIGKPVPDAVMVDVDGKKLKISDFKGKVLLLNFWSPY